MSTLDIHDDNGALLVELADQIPDSLKTASIADPKDVDGLPNDLFALIIDRPGKEPLRKFACTDGPTTYVSALYLTRTHRSLTPEAVKVAAQALQKAADVYRIGLPAKIEELAKTGGLTPPEETRLEENEKTANLNEMLEEVRKRRQEKKFQKQADLVGTELMPVGTPRTRSAGAKKLASVSQIVQLEGPTVEQLEPTPRDIQDGVKTAGAVYPLDKMRDILDIEDAFQNGITKIAAQDRTVVAQSLVQREKELGVPSSPQALKYAGCHFRPPRELEAALDQRKVMGSRMGKGLDVLAYDKLASFTNPLEYAEKLAAIDRFLGLDREWDRSLEDPWGATLASEKTADIIYNKNGVFVSDNQLKRMAAKESKKVLCAILDEDMVEEFIRDPVGVFQSMPEPMKQAIGRLTNDQLWRGDPK